MGTTTAKRKLRDITEVDVLEAAVEQLSQRRGYTADYYFVTPEGLSREFPGDDVGACCAIGGVEQAIWKLTGRVVTDNRGIAYGDRPDRLSTNRLYWRVMRRLDDVARRKHPKLLAGRNGCAIEQLTFAAGKPTVVRAFRTALEEARAEQ